MEKVVIFRLVNFTNYVEFNSKFLQNLERNVKQNYVIINYI